MQHLTTERERGAAAQIGVKTKRKQGSASKIIIFLWICPVSTFLTTVAFNLKLQQVFHKTRVKSVDSDSQAIYQYKVLWMFLFLKNIIEFSLCEWSKYHKDM